MHFYLILIQIDMLVIILNRKFRTENATSEFFSTFHQIIGIVLIRGQSSVIKNPILRVESSSLHFLSREKCML